MPAPGTQGPGISAPRASSGLQPLARPLGFPLCGLGRGRVYPLHGLHGHLSRPEGAPQPPTPRSLSHSHANPRVASCADRRRPAQDSLLRRAPPPRGLGRRRLATSYRRGASRTVGCPRCLDWGMRGRESGSSKPHRSPRGVEGREHGEGERPLARSRPGDPPHPAQPASRHITPPP